MEDGATLESRPRILLVEDDEVTRHLVVRWLTREGYEVDGFGDAESALARLRVGTYSAVVTDFHLPEMTGLEMLVAAIAAGLVDPAHAMIVSSFPPVKEATALGVGTLRKPVDVQEFLGRIEQLLGTAVKGERAPLSTERPALRLLLYVSSGSVASTRARRTVWQLAHRPGAEHVHLEVWDVTERAAEAAAHRVLFTPTLLRLEPAPVLRITGDLRDESVLTDAIASSAGGTRKT